VKGFVPFALIHLVLAQRSVKETRDVSKGEMGLFARLSPAYSRVDRDEKKKRGGRRSIVIPCMLKIPKTANRDILRIRWARPGQV
jgi:hypothetical protein